MLNVPQSVVSRMLKKHGEAVLAVLKKGNGKEGQNILLQDETIFSCACADGTAFLQESTARYTSY